MIIFISSKLTGKVNRLVRQRQTRLLIKRLQPEFDKLKASRRPSGQDA
ncbi:hypothetical protein ACFFSY_07120 [Paenibacillus aurantiacus]|uniref:Fur-regulated basic protein FbpA n=1 Tax=Paenibacillus aurantiacus TaxID=1936118 RepID=A0ABV5KMT2_9BACL